MYRFKLNDNIKKYIREVEVVLDKVQIVRDYLRELDCECDITISIGESEFKFNRFIVLPDWEAQCFRIDKKNRGISFNHMNELFDLQNTFKIPFTTVLGGHVKFVTTWYGNVDLTDKFIELIETSYGGKSVVYRYEFIPEAWRDDHKTRRVYRINDTFYDIMFDEKNDKLTLTTFDDPCHDVTVTAIDLLCGKYDNISQRPNVENGLLIPKLLISMYETKEDRDDKLDQRSHS